jgi:hypothetical protein
MTTTTLPAEVLEARAAEQRRQLHNSVQNLRSAVRDRMDLKRNVRQHFLPAAGLVGLAGLVFGYSITGLFTRH